MLALWNWLCGWIDGFVYGTLVSVDCEYCPFFICEEEFSSYPNEEAIIVAALEHSCPVESRRQLEMISRRFGCYHESYTISKKLWESTL